uniref:Uncharacterized protein n=1 Tax=Peronospora matthiolae TaxID=2874970 RepID=A0AAV1UPQ1_9STRA
MTYYRFGQRLKMTRAVARAMARSSAGKRNPDAIEKLIQNNKSRFGRAVVRPLGAAVATFMDSGVAFNTSSEFLYFDSDDDDGTVDRVDHTGRKRSVECARETSHTGRNEGIRIHEALRVLEKKPCRLLKQDK